MFFAKNRRKNAADDDNFFFLFFFFAGRKLGLFSIFFIGLHLRLPAGIESKVFATQMSLRVVETQYGRLRGILVPPPDPTLPQVEAFLGLEYASLLGGELRFMAPTSPVGRWQGIRQALKFKPVCPQRLPDLREMKATMSSARFERWKRLVPFLERQQEECLNLNVYVPLRAANDTRLLPVVLFVHGESYDAGTGNAYDGSILSAFGKIVVITMNYRLGVLGFMTTGDIHAPGNFGLLDQVAALHWIADNIRVFGGDPDQVTLMGHGHGAALVNLLLVSPITSGKQLFKRAILQSGSALSSWAFASDPLRHTKELSRRLNCSLQDSLLIVQCLRQYSYEILVSVPVTREKYNPTFGPNVDGRTVLPVFNTKRYPSSGTSSFEGHSGPQYSASDISAGGQTAPTAQRLNSCPLVFGATSLLLGVLSHEGYRYFTDEDVGEGLSELRWVRTLRTFVQNVFRYHLQKIYDILAHNYHDWDHPKDRQAVGRGLAELLGDGLYAAPVIELAQRHVACNTAAPTFLYSLVLDGETTAENGSHGGQGDELSSVFGAPLANGIEPFGSRFSAEEKRLSEVVMTYWVNFIRSGNPNGVDHQKEKQAVVEWPPYDSQNQPYLLISNNPSVHHHYKSRKMALWLELIPKIHRPDPSPNPLLHLLHDFRNRSSFEDRGTRQIDLVELADQPTTLAVPTPSAFDYPDTSGHHMDAASPSSSSFKLPNLPRRVTPPKLSKNRTTLPPVPAYNQRTFETLSQTSLRPSLDSVVTFNPEGLGPAESSNLGSLRVTLAIGLGLLLLNLTVFGATFYQWRRLDQTSGLCSPDLVDKSPLDATSNHRSALRYDAVSASFLTGTGKDGEPTPPYDGTPVRARFGCEDTPLSLDITTKDSLSSSVELRTDENRIENHVAYPSTEV